MLQEPQYQVLNNKEKNFNSNNHSKNIPILTVESFLESNKACPYTRENLKKMMEIINLIISKQNNDDKMLDIYMTKIDNLMNDNLKYNNKQLYNGKFNNMFISNVNNSIVQIRTNNKGIEILQNSKICNNEKNLQEDLNLQKTLKLNNDNIEEWNKCISKIEKIALDYKIFSTVLPNIISQSKNNNKKDFNLNENASNSDILAFVIVFYIFVKLKIKVKSLIVDEKIYDNKSITTMCLTEKILDDSFESEYVDVDVKEIDFIIGQMKYVQRILNDSLLNKKADEIVKHYDNALYLTSTDNSSILKTVIKEKEDLINQLTEKSEKLKENNLKRIKLLKELEKIDFENKELKIEIENLDEKLKETTEVIQKEQLKKLEEKEKISIYNNVNVGSGASSDCFLAVSSSGEQFCCKFSRKLNQSKTFLDSYKKYSWIKQEEYSYSIMKSSKVNTCVRIENFKFHRAIIQPIFPYGDLDINIKMMNTHRMGEINYFYMNYIQKNQSFKMDKNTIVENQLQFWKPSKHLTLFIFNEIMDTLSVLKKYKCSHRDIKPSNFIFNESFDLILIDLQLNIFFDNGIKAKTNSHGTTLYQKIDKFYDKETVSTKNLSKNDIMALAVILNKLHKKTDFDDIFKDLKNILNPNVKKSTIQQYSDEIMTHTLLKNLINIIKDEKYQMLNFMEKNKRIKGFLKEYLMKNRINSITIDKDRINEIFSMKCNFSSKFETLSTASTSKSTIKETTITMTIDEVIEKIVLYFEKNNEFQDLIMNMTEANFSDRYDLKEIMEDNCYDKEAFQKISKTKKLYEDMNLCNKEDINDSLSSVIKKRANRKPLLEIKKLSYYDHCKTDNFDKMKEEYLNNGRKRKVIFEEI